MNVPTLTIETIGAGEVIAEIDDTTGHLSIRRNGQLELVLSRDIWGLLKDFVEKDYFRRASLGLPIDSKPDKF